MKDIETIENTKLFFMKNVITKFHKECQEIIIEKIEDSIREKFKNPEIEIIKKNDEKIKILGKLWLTLWHNIL